VGMVYGEERAFLGMAAQVTYKAGYDEPVVNTHLVRRPKLGSDAIGQCR